MPGSHQAGDFVAWYNGHPDFSDCRFDLSHEVAIIVGHGNVALDVARILAKTVDELRHTDIAAHALEVLADSKVREVNIVGRGGPAQTRFTAKELHEFLDLDECEATLAGQDRPPTTLRRKPDRTRTHMRSFRFSAFFFKTFRQSVDAVSFVLVSRPLPSKDEAG
jgi:ferredoxin/flavodoxin---NADP+ reductase